MMIRTERLALIPCSLGIAEAFADGRRPEVAGLSVQVPPDWPGPDLRDFLPVYAKMLKNDPAVATWGIWLMVDPAEQMVIGDLGFKGAPDVHGAVEIGYSILPAYRRQGLTFEAVQALVRWAFTEQGVQVVHAECLADNLASVRILEKLGMERLAPEGEMLHWLVRQTHASQPRG
jgi:ribosomal-protein-alanine N-acetyltransferase